MQQEFFFTLNATIMGNSGQMKELLAYVFNEKTGLETHIRGFQGISSACNLVANSRARINK